MFCRKVTDWIKDWFWQTFLKTPRTARAPRFAHLGPPQPSIFSPESEWCQNKRWCHPIWENSRWSHCQVKNVISEKKNIFILLFLSLFYYFMFTSQKLGLLFTTIKDVPLFVLIQLTKDLIAVKYLTVQMSFVTSQNFYKSIMRNELPGWIFSLIIVTWSSRSGLVCSCQKPITWPSSWTTIPNLSQFLPIDIAWGPFPLRPT